jgi:hypothetical protein
MNDVETQLKAAIAKVDATTMWDTKASDANYFDASQAAPSLYVDRLPTGNVFRKGLPFQISINGIQNNNTVDVCFTDNHRTLNVNMTQAQSHAHLSLSNLNTLLMANPSRLRKDLDKQLATLSEPLLLAIKRAGDWGQIAHCVKYQKVFVTSDRFAALYAHYKGVRFMLLRRREYSLQNIPDFISYTFILRKKV